MHWLNPRHWSMVLALVLLLISQPNTQAQLMTVTVSGIDTLLETAKYTLKMAGKEDMANQIDSLLEAFLQNQGFKGIDTSKPMGAYLNKFPSNPRQPNVVVYIPISNETDFVSLLERLNVSASKEEKGIRSIQIPGGQQLYLGFKNSHAYLSMDEKELNNPADPSKFAASLSANGLVHLHLGLNEIPKDLKDKFLAEVDKGIEREKHQREGEKDFEYQARLAGMNLPKQAIEILINDADSLDVSFSLDKKQHVFVVDSLLSPKSGTRLQKEMQAMNGSRSQFASLLASAPASVVYHGIINDAVRKDLDNLLDNLVKKAISEEKSIVKKAIAEKIYGVIEPTLKSNSYEFAFSMKSHGDNEPMTGLGAVRVKDGKKLEELVKGLIVEMKGKERQAIQIDAAKVGDVNIHVINIPADDKGAKDMVQAFGEAKISLAFHNDAIVAGIGKNSTEEVKKAVASIGSSDGSPPPMQLLIHTKPFARLIKEEPVRKAFQTVFTTPDSDLVKATITGGDRLKVHFQISTHFLKLIEAAEKNRGE